MKKVDAFWDASAIVPLCVGQPGSGFARTALRNRSIAVWWGTPVETISAFARLARAGDLDERQFQMAIARLATVCGSDLVEATAATTGVCLPGWRLGKRGQ